jgi:hypothetical protein
VYADSKLDVSKGDFEVPIGCENRVLPTSGGAVGLEDYDGLFGEGDAEIDENQPIPAGLPRETEEYIPSDSTNFDPY